jgi:beta-glucanase (GH16 family)
MKRFVLFLAQVGTVNLSVFDNDALDHCTAVANPGQQDGDGDGHGNHCDADLNNSCGAISPESIVNTKHNLRFYLVALLYMVCEAAFANMPIYADGDVGPLGSPDSLLDAGDVLVLQRIVLGQLIPSDIEYSHGDLYPAGAPDGVLNLQDLLLLQQQVLAPGGNSYVEVLDLFIDGPATLTGSVGGTSASTTATINGWTGAGATVINNPNLVDPADPTNTLWHFSVSDGAANAYLGTGNLSGHAILDSGFDLSGTGSGFLVFDIYINSIAPGAVIKVKIDSGWPDLGFVTLQPSQYTVGSWRRVVIDFTTLLANPDPQGNGLDLANVVNAFVIEVTGGDADFYLDNVFITHACPLVDGCSASINTKAAPSGGYVSPMSYPGYTLVWNDEFNGTSLNLADWTYEIGGGGWGNNELQYYRAENTSVGNGLLTIEAREENFGGRNYTSSRLKTQAKQFFRYGKIDIRAALPYGQGLWPALWMLGESFAQVGWPASGEIDIMEMIGGNGREDTVHGTVHWQHAGTHASYGGSQTLSGETYADKYHVFGIEWDSTAIRWFVDGVQYHVIDITPAELSELHGDFFFIFNVAVGGNWPGSPDATTLLPQRMLVDYVRVFDRN